MLTVACTLYDGRDVPDYSKNIFTSEWADKLYRGVRRNLDVDLRFVCVTDEPKESFAESEIEVLPFLNYRHNMWCIVECLRVRGDPVLFMGLDTIITGDITAFGDQRYDFAMMQDPYHDRLCSGVMMWRDAKHIYDQFVADGSKHDSRIAGHPSDMIWLDRKTNAVNLEKVFPGWIRSYKGHVKANGIGDTRIVVFHGREKPHEIDHPVLEHWR